MEAGSGNAGYIDEFCLDAWQDGWLRRYEQEYLTEWRCSYPNPCDCEDTNPDGWYIFEIIPLHIYREVFP